MGALWPESDIYALTLHYIVVIIRHHEGIEHIKCLSGIFCRVFVQYQAIRSIIFDAIYRAVSFQLSHFSCHRYQNMCTLSYYRHEVGTMND